MKTVLISVVATLVVILVAGVLVLYSGVFNVAADAADPPGLDWVLATARESSVERRSESIQVPDLGGDAVIRTGFDHYREMCVGCHGGPGVPRGEGARGLNPSPPDLSRGESDTPHLRETFWVIKHGIKMTGMPSFGVTHSDDQIWALVAFVRELQRGLGPDEYARMAKDAGAGSAANAEQGETGDTDGDVPDGSS